MLEDTATSSMAGQFESVIGITDFDEFTAAVRRVLDSRDASGLPGTPIAVLIQPLIDPRHGGVLFGIDPVTGRTDRRVVAAVDGGPERLVSGTVDGSRYVLDPRGHVVSFTRADGPELSRAQLRELVALSDSVARVFDGPQDVEWAIEHDGRLVLLQSRPVTTEVRGVPVGPIYGPGPVAETFPEPLTELEHDLWVPPLRDAVGEAVVIAGAATRAEVAQSEVVVNVARSGRHRPPARRGAPHEADAAAAPQPRPRGSPSRRRRGASGGYAPRCPVLAERLLDRVDDDLAAVPSLDELSSRQLVALFHRGHVVLRSLHAHEILMGLLTDVGGNQMTGASIALRVLAEARREGLTDQDVLERSPVVLALTPPRVAPRAELPRESFAVNLGADSDSANDNGILREALRLRVRWVQELTGRAAWELGVRLTRAGDLLEPDMIRHMTLDHVEAVFTKRAVVVAELVQTHLHNFGDAAAGGVPPQRPRQGHARTVRRRGRRWHRCRWRVEAGGRHLRPRQPARRFGARHRDAHTRSRDAAAAAQRDRRRNRLGAVAPRDPGPRSRACRRSSATRTRCRRCPRAPRCWSTAKPDASRSPRRRRTHETARLARRHRNPRRAPPRTRSSRSIAGSGTAPSSS